MDRKAPIGIFDSGLGGLTVVKALRKELPEESVLYLADSVNAPYGSLTKQQITEYSFSNTRFLLDRGAKMIVVACNTATGAAIKQLRNAFNVPFVGMEPAVKPAAANSRSKKIGVLATARTFEADHFNSTMDRFAGDVEVFVRIGEGLVELIEDGKTENRETEVLLRSYLDPLLKKGIDQLVLGCTHYPYLLPLMRRILPAEVIVHDPSPAVARHVRRVLEENGGLNTGKKLIEDRFFSTGRQEILDEFVANFL